VESGIAKEGNCQADRDVIGQIRLPARRHRSPAMQLFQRRARRGPDRLISDGAIRFVAARGAGAYFH